MARRNHGKNRQGHLLFPTADGDFILAAGNDGHHRRFCISAGFDALAEDPRFATNKLRVAHRDELRIVACVEDPDVIEKILTDLDVKGGGEPEATRRPPSLAPPQRGLFDETG